MNRLLDLVRARKLDRIGAAYAVAAWLAVQAVSIMAPAFGWPEWTTRVVIVVAILGLPITLIAAWFLSDEGTVVIRVGEKTRPQYEVYGLLTLFAVTIAISAWQFGPALFRSKTPAAAPKASPLSIAVLPFVNMSGDPSKEYFSDGFSEELLNRLANTSRLRVAARTSSFSFKGAQIDIQEIAKKLHVGALLEGSVRLEANHVRITAQLINAVDGFNLWSQSFDRDMTDVLTLQDEISAAIVEALTHALHINFPKRSAIDAEAYRLVLQAKALSLHGNQDELERAVTLLNTAIQRQPNYAEGYARLCTAQAKLMDRYNKLEYRVPSETSCRQSIAIDPKNMIASTALTELLLDRWQWNEALEVYKKTQGLNPNSPDVLHMRAVLAYTFNFPEEDIKAELKSAELDPLRPGTHYNIALWYTYQNRFDEAATAIEHVLRMRTGKHQDLDQQCAIEAGRRNFKATDQIIPQLAPFFAESPQNAMNCLYYTAIARKDFVQARKLTDAAAIDAAINGGSYQTIGDAYRQLGDFKAAMPWFERAYAEHDPLLILTPFEKWQTQELLSNPAWKAIWARPPIRAWEAARVEVGKILGVAH